MSEYQYYEFQALDRPLTESEQAYIRSLSRRVSLTPTQAIFTYQYGNFPGDPKRILEKYFDAMLYIANWGTKQLMFRLPRSVTDVSGLDRYCFPRIITTSVTKVSVILDICFQEEKGGYWVEGEGQLSALKYPMELTDLRWKERITMELNDGQLPVRRIEFDSS